MESNKRICKQCKILKTRIEIGKFPNSKDKRYEDEDGKLWNGSLCPPCNTERLKLKMKQKRSS